MHTIVISDIDHCGEPGDIKVKVEAGELEDDITQELPWQVGK